MENVFPHRLHNTTHLCASCLWLELQELFFFSLYLSFSLFIRIYTVATTNALFLVPLTLHLIQCQYLSDRVFWIIVLINYIYATPLDLRPPWALTERRTTDTENIFNKKLFFISTKQTFWHFLFCFFFYFLFFLVLLYDQTQS